ncbi:MAG TPA: integrase core domain-containing protein, partial [Propionibacteriaceae bacterium]|nr:integrase core domain-containing protein [Propionibacteriaceae bacterium]
DHRQLQTQLDTFTELYNTRRPHRALNQHTPRQAYDATVKAGPAGAINNPHFRVRRDRVDSGGKISLRRAGRMHHLGVGARHANTPVLIIIDGHTATVTALTTGEILSAHTVDPDRTYWRNTQTRPGRWPRPNMNDDSTQI